MKKALQMSPVASFADFDCMRAEGIFHPDAFYELIRGEIVEMPRPRSRHIRRVNKLNDLFTSTLNPGCVPTTLIAYRSNFSIMPRNGS